MKKLILSKDEILRIEKETIEKYGISNLVLMENAGRESFYIIKREVKDFKRKNFYVFCGKGNNGGDGFVLARYLFNNESKVQVYYIGKPEEFTEVSYTNFLILKKLRVDTIPINDLKLNNQMDLKKGSIIIDALLGIGVKGEIKGKMKEVIDFINSVSLYKVSIDIPSGLDADSGEIHGTCVKSDLTISMGFLKKGFFERKGPEYVGKIKIVDIGFPKYFYETL